jgi:hypothetical protein
MTPCLLLAQNTNRPTVLHLQLPNFAGDCVPVYIGGMLEDEASGQGWDPSVFWNLGGMVCLRAF